jgi:hypothetical protein
MHFGGPSGSEIARTPAGKDVRDVLPRLRDD